MRGIHGFDEQTVWEKAGEQAARVELRKVAGRSWQAIRADAPDQAGQSSRAPASLAASASENITAGAHNAPAQLLISHHAPLHSPRRVQRRVGRPVAAGLGVRAPVPERRLSTTVCTAPACLTSPSTRPIARTPPSASPPPPRAPDNHRPREPCRPPTAHSRRLQPRSTQNPRTPLRPPRNESARPAKQTRSPTVNSPRKSLNPRNPTPAPSKPCSKMFLTF